VTSLEITPVTYPDNKAYTMHFFCNTAVTFLQYHYAASSPDTKRCTLLIQSTTEALHYPAANISINVQNAYHSRQLCPHSALQHLKKMVIGSSAERIWCWRK